MSVMCKWCLVKVPQEQHLAHCRTDWHHLNMKRKLADMPPLSNKEFQAFTKKIQEAENSQKTRDVLYCTACKKKFASKIAYENHVLSNKHIRNVSESEDDHEPVIVKKPVEGAVKPESDIDDDWDDLSDVDELEDVDSTMCVFCSLMHENLSHNIRHMAEVHSFFIPDVEFCSDIGGLIGYLIVKAHKDFLCLWCSAAGFASVDAVQKHMRDKGHCMMRFDGDVVEEYEMFYDYSSTYPEGEAPEATPIAGDEFQLVLPSGNVIGNRSLARYYKQRFNSLALALVPKKRHSRMYLSKLAAPVQAQGRRNVAKWNRQYTKWYMQLGTKANNLQKHFRVQVNF
ncbi:cytoplasmic 60S subunit biogenesis factor ZNF622 [Phlebotomus argentipes]|uniref:cytoplasmic 60S subunit biogenesis factor ZNF622 n=1 Tax=Phlebotomus argentipes TaxID=94469 RepID=UPI0028937A62|nr:cytoplasmic 60S subunit biogenesis factor ZNF622 [Phlebotomus argentipes]